MYRTSFGEVVDWQGYRGGRASAGCVYVGLYVDVHVQNKL